MVFNDKQAAFLADEFGMHVKPGEKVQFTREERHELREKCIEIEIDESWKSRTLSERGQVAVSLVDLLRSPQ